MTWTWVFALLALAEAVGLARLWWDRQRLHRAVLDIEGRIAYWRELPDEDHIGKPFVIANLYWALARLGRHYGR